MVGQSNKSPGIGTWPSPISPTSEIIEIIMVGRSTWGRGHEGRTYAGGIRRRGGTILAQVSPPLTYTSRGGVH